jgi:hypothetical protein
MPFILRVIVFRQAEGLNIALLEQSAKLLRKHMSSVQ